MAKPLSSRWMDCLYLLFFLIHIPVMLCKSDGFTPCSVSQLCTPEGEKGYMKTSLSERHLKPPLTMSRAAPSRRLNTQGAICSGLIVAISDAQVAITSLKACTRAL